MEIIVWLCPYAAFFVPAMLALVEPIQICILNDINFQLRFSIIDSRVLYVL